MEERKNQQENPHHSSELYGGVLMEQGGMPRKWPICQGWTQSWGKPHDSEDRLTKKACKATIHGRTAHQAWR